MVHQSGVGHEHCPACGTCLIAGLTQKNHRCLTAIETEIWEVMRADMGTTEEQTRHMLRTDFNREMARGGFQITSGR